MENLIFRTIELNLRGLNEKKRTVPAILSTDTPIVVRRNFGPPVHESLEHTSSAIDLTRAKDGQLPLLKNHDSDKLVGAVERVRLDGNKLVGVLRFSKNSDGTEVFDDVKDGFLRGISIGFSIQDEEQQGDVTVVTKWKPHEASVTPIPADDGAQILRSNNMDTNVTQFPADRSGQNEFDRQKGIRDLFKPFQRQLGTQYDAQQTTCLSDPSCDIEAARTRLLKALGEGNSPAGGDPVGEFGQTYMRGNGDELLRAGIDAVLIRSGVPVKEPHPAARDLMGSTMVDFARMHLNQVGVNTSGLSRTKLIERALTTSDFPLLLENIADKTVLQGYNEAPGTHRGWTTQAFARDFKDKAFVLASEAPDLELVNENGEFKYGALTEDGSKVALATYGKLLAVTRQALINDDTGALISAARNFGAAAMRLESDIVYGNLIANPVMSDGNTLFHATHNNIGTGGVPSVTTLGEARELLRNQKGIGGSAFLDLQPFAVLAPAALETVFEQLLSSLFDPFPATGTSDSAARNPFANRLDLIIDPRLDADSTTRWYVVTNPNIFNWAYRVFLDDNGGQPFIAEQLGWTVDGTEIKARHDFATIITEFRGIVKNDGV